MTPFDFECQGWTDAGYHTIKMRAMRTATPSILVTEAEEVEGAFRLTHEPSGMAITTGDYATSGDVFGLFALAAELASCGDWSRSAADVCDDKALCAKVRAALTSSSIEWIGLSKSEGHEKASFAVRTKAVN